VIKLPADRHGNEGWVVKARKPHRCAMNNTGCMRIIEPGSFYYRAIVWPSSDFYEGRAPWVMKICRACLHEEMRRSFDAIVSPQPEPTALQLRTGPWRDIQGDVWALGEDGLLHTPETRAFPREHVEKKWGPLVVESPGPAPESLPPASAASTAPSTHSTPAEGRDETTA
jgi:hypothetical protein